MLLFSMLGQLTFDIELFRVVPRPKQETFVPQYIILSEQAILKQRSLTETAAIWRLIRA
jgi:hypothetical protein